METISLLCMITFGCFEPKEAKAAQREQLLNQLKQIDLQFMTYQATLIGPATSDELRKEILCEEFPFTFEQKYQPLLIKLEKTAKTESSNELLETFNAYKTTFNIEC